MLKKIILRAALAAGTIGLAVSFLPGGAATVLGPTIPVASTGATTIAFSPASNPAFKVNGFTTCANGRSGNLWVATTITATSVKDTHTDAVVVTLGSGSAHHTYTLAAPSFSVTVPTTDSFNCSTLNGSSLPYTATSFRSGSAQSGGGASSTGNYSITKID